MSLFQILEFFMQVIHILFLKKREIVRTRVFKDYGFTIWHSSRIKFPLLFPECNLRYSFVVHYWILMFLLCFVTPVLVTTSLNTFIHSAVHNTTYEVSKTTQTLLQLIIPLRFQIQNGIKIILMKNSTRHLFDFQFPFHQILNM